MSNKNLMTQVNNSVNCLHTQDIPTEMIELSDEDLQYAAGGRSVGVSFPVISFPVIGSPFGMARNAVHSSSSSSGRSDGVSFPVISFPVIGSPFGMARNAAHSSSSSSGRSDGVSF